MIGGYEKACKKALEILPGIIINFIVISYALSSSWRMALNNFPLHLVLGLPFGSMCSPTSSSQPENLAAKCCLGVPFSVCPGDSIIW